MIQAMTETIERSGRPGRPGRPARPRWPAGRARTSPGFGAFVRRHGLAPYLLLAPGLAGIALVLLWPLVQVVTYSFQNLGLPQLTGAQPTQWVGLSNFTQTFADPEFWLSLRITVLFAAVVVPLTLVIGTLVGLILNRLGKVMAAFVSTAALL